MKRFSMVAIALIIFAVPMFAKESSDAAIRATDQAFAAAWNRHDVQAMAASWAINGDLVNPQGRVANGRNQIELLLQDEHATAFRNSTYTPGPMSIRFIQPGIAVSESDTEISGITNPDGTNAPVMKVHILRVVQKIGGKWMTVTARPVIYPVVPKT